MCDLLLALSTPGRSDCDSIFHIIFIDNNLSLNESGEEKLTRKRMKSGLISLTKLLSVAFISFPFDHAKRHNKHFGYRLRVCLIWRILWFFLCEASAVLKCGRKHKKSRINFHNISYVMRSCRRSWKRPAPGGVDGRNMEALSPLSACMPRNQLYPYLSKKKVKK